ncbi:MAG: hypothetical protein U0167_19555 [bacterium]
MLTSAVEWPKRAKLTDALARKLEFTLQGQHVVRDTELPGFRLVVGKTAKTWSAQRDVRDGKERVRTERKTFGRVDALSCRDARQQARAWLGEPMAARLAATNGSSSNGNGAANARNGVITLRTAWERYLTSHLEPKVERRERSPRTVEAMQHDIEKHLAAWLDLPLASIGKERVADRHEQMVKTSGPVAADNCFRYFRAVYRFARRKMDGGEHLPQEPTTALDFVKRQGKKRAMRPEEFPRWYAQLQALPNPVRREFYLFQLLSGSRPDALKRARWEHLDESRRVLHFPDPKGGPRRAFDLALSTPMLECLARAKEAGRIAYPDKARTWIFPGRSPRGHIRNTQQRQRRPEDARFHFGVELRKTWRGVAQAAGVGPDDRRVLLNHASSEVHDVYLDPAAILGHLVECQERISKRMVELLTNGA